MKHIFTFLFVISFVFQCSGLMAQEESVIRGRVTDKESGEPLPGVNIVELDKNGRVVNGVITDVNGNYVFEVSNAEHTIQVSFVGYKKETFKINQRTRINVQLEPKTASIDEVTVTAEAPGNTLTGVTDRNQTGASSKVDMDKLSGRSEISVASALKGQVSGLDIVSASGAPGSGSSVVIRGMGSLGNTNPLIVVDGIAQEVNTQDFNFAAADQRDLGQLLNIAPQDIASVEVLKDAASTAVWGSKGANGVLVIETKQGTKGDISYTYQYKVSANLQRDPIPMLDGDEYITLQMEQLHNARGLYQIPPELSNDRSYAEYYNYSDNTDWIDRISRNSYTHDHYFKMSGGGEKSKYYTSINYQDELGTTINTSFQRFSYRANFHYSISNNLRFVTNFSYTNQFREDNPKTTILFSQGTNRFRRMNVRRLAYVKAPNMSIWEHDEDGNLTDEYFTPIESYQGAGDRYLNPVAIADLAKDDSRENAIQNNFKINYTISDWLRFKETVSFSYSSEKEKEFIPSSAIGVNWLDGQNNEASEQNSRSTRLMSRSQFFINPLRSLDNHSLTSVLMWEMEDEQSKGSYASVGNGPSIFINDPALNSPVRRISSGSKHSRVFGALASLNYSFKDRYILNANLRADGSSAFGRANQWGLFPSVSMGWRFSSENFLQSWNFLNDSKLRLSWGQSGDHTIWNPYATYAYFETSNRYMQSTGIVPAQMRLSRLRWQTVTSQNAGIDLNLFDYRIAVTADVYRRVTKDIMWNNYEIPSSTGFDRLGFYNGGKIENKGWEFFIRGDVVDQKNTRWSLNFNISQNFNSFLSFPENFNKQVGTSIGNGIYPRRAEVGKPIGSFYGFRYLGVYPTDEDAVARNKQGDILRDANGNPIPMTYQETYEFQGGDAIYEDINHDGKINLQDAVYIGDSSPLFIGGFGSTFEYKQFSASFNFSYRLGFDIVNQVAMDTESMLNKNNQSKAVLYRWRREGQDDKGLLPRAYMNHPANNLGSDRYVESGDFVKLNSIQLTYRLSDQLTKQLNLNTLDIGFNMRNVITFTTYSGVDPEIGRVEPEPFFLGTDEGRTPPPRVYTLRLNMNF
jgi:TonB-linked SusC/RagA family outer membrane protein